MGKNEEHLQILYRGRVVWNQWRKEHRSVRVDFSGVDLSGIDLAGGNFGGVDFSGAILDSAILGASYLRRANFRGAHLIGAILRIANFTGADLRGAQLWSADLREAILDKADLTEAMLPEANLGRARLNGANLSNASITLADCSGANLSGANLSGANLSGANLSGANLSGANLSGADLTRTSLVETNIENANLIGCRIYGISAWNLRVNQKTKQSNLIVTQPNEATIRVDNLEVAQFIYLLLNNPKIRDVIDSVTSKAVLILGRFSPERKAVLDAIHVRLREDYGLVPILFDWEPSASRDLTETIVTLAGMCRFIIADLTDASSIPQELSHIIPTFQSVPIRPILLASKKKYAMYPHWENFNNVLPIFPYSDTRHLLKSLKTKVIGPLEIWESNTDKERAKRHEAAEREQRLQQQNAKQAARIAELKAQLRRQ